MENEPLNAKNSKSKVRKVCSLCLKVSLFLIVGLVLGYLLKNYLSSKPLEAPPKTNCEPPFYKSQFYANSEIAYKASVDDQAFKLSEFGQKKDWSYKIYTSNDPQPKLMRFINIVEFENIPPNVLLEVVYNRTWSSLWNNHFHSREILNTGNIADNLDSFFNGSIQNPSVEHQRMKNPFPLSDTDFVIKIAFEFYQFNGIPIMQVCQKGLNPGENDDYFLAEEPEFQRTSLDDTCSLVTYSATYGHKPTD